ncbi:MAG: hypothetical protein V1802_00185 [Candidatus Aenigmatarchaeota archaeon]
MTYAEIETIQRPAKIVFEPEDWRKQSYQDRFNQTDTSGYEVFLLESTNNFNNRFQQMMEEIYKKWGCFGLIFRDIVRNGGKGTNDRGMLNLDYISHAGTQWERKYNVWAPKYGLFVPNDDCETINGMVVPFVPGTLVPFETVSNGREAKKKI